MRTAAAKLDSAAWRAQLLVSAHKALIARDDAKPTKERARHDLVHASCAAEVRAAYEARTRLIATRADLLARVQSFAATDDAERLFAHAACAVRMRTRAITARTRCVITNRLETGCVAVTLFGNRAVGGGVRTVRARTDSTPTAIGRRWVPLLRALILACNTPEWLDELVASDLLAPDTDVLTADTIPACAALDDARKASNHACRYIRRQFPD
jgi:hypothetical protein